MLGGAIFQQVLRIVRDLELPEAAARDLLAVLQAGNPGPLPAVNEAGYEAGLSRDQILDRGAGVFLCFAAGNLADDIMDGDCTYLDDPVRLGPCYQFLLQNLAFDVLSRTSVPREVLARCARELALAAGPQPLEMRAETFDFALYQVVGAGIAGRQWGAYLTLLWAGTHLEPRALHVGRMMGYVSLLVSDLESNDRRFYSQSPDDQRRTLEHALALVEELKSEDLRTVGFMVPRAEQVLRSRM